MPPSSHQAGQLSASSQQQQQQQPQQRQQQQQQNYYPQSQQHHYHHQQAQQQPLPPPQQQPDRSLSQPIGRSQSAFNFLLNKAKAPFSSSSSSSALNASTSFYSLSTHQEDPFDDTTNQIHYHRQLQNDHAFPHAPPPSSNARRVPNSSVEKTPRAPPQQQYQAEFSATPQPSRPSGLFSRPSYSEEPQNAVASPTKRSFFGGIGRDRKASTASIKQPVPQKPNFSYSPLSKTHRPEPSASSYAHFSKSQSDLHARAEFPSPSNITVELPRVPAVYQQHAPAAADRNRYLRSPSPAMNFSRSVDDLSSIEQPVSPFPASPGYDESTSTLATVATSTSPGTWGEHGVPAIQTDWRPSDMGTLASPTQQHSASLQRFKPGHHKIDSVTSQVQPSSGSVQSPPNNWSGMSPPQYSYLQAAAAQRSDARHTRKASKLAGKDNAGRGVVANSLAASLGLTNLGTPAAAPASLSIQTASEPTPLPPGAVFQGFLVRNANISLTLSQLSGHDHGKGKDREKDITKGWKPYRVVLQDGRLCFYKPPSNVSDEVKSLFPTNLVRSMPVTPASSTSSSGLNADMLLRSGLSKQDLLSATSSTAELTSPLPSPSLRPRNPAARQVSNKAALPSGELSATPSVAALLSEGHDAGERSWVKPGKHPDLVLVDTIDAPQGWVERIQSGSVSALAHEFVNATQLPSAAELGSTLVQRQSAASPALAQSTACSSSEFLVEAFVVAVLASSSASNSAGGETTHEVSDRFASFMVAVHRQAEDTLAAAQGGSKDAQDICASVKSRITTMIDVAVRSGIAQTPKAANALHQLACLVQLEGDDLATKLKVYDTPVLEADTLVTGDSTDWIARARETRLSDEREELQELRTSFTLSDELLLRLEPLEIAQQIHLFHADALRRLAGPHLSFYEIVEAAKVNKSSVAALSFDSMSPHPLTALALKHLLSTSSAGREAPNTVQNGARHRASVLRHWIAVASYLLTLGDVAGWMAICTALCSRAVTRLEQTWRYLAEGDRVLVAEEWAPILSSISWTEGLTTNVQPRFAVDGAEHFVAVQDGRKFVAIPFLGNALYRFVRHSDNMSASPTKADFLKLASCAEDALYLFRSVSEWRAAWQPPVTDNPLIISSHSEPLPAFQATLQLLFQDTAALKATFDSDMDRSFQLEAKALGNLDARERRWLPTSVNPSLPLVPLLFPQPLPLLSLLNATEIKSELFQRDEQRAKPGSDPQATITSRSSGRPTLAGSPLIRSTAFSPPLGPRSGRGAAFNGVLEWSLTGPTTSWEDPNNSIIKVGNELVLRVVQEPNISLPSSPMTNKRFSQDFGRASRPLSQISKRSSLPASNRSSVVDIVVPVQVVVKAATLDRMIDLLIMGVQHVSMSPSAPADDGTEAQNSLTRKTRLVMDMEAYRSTFLATFRSLCSPAELFEQLQKRFSTAVTASKELTAANEFLTSSQFPSWIPLTPAGSQAEPTDWDMVYRIRMGTVLTLRMWIDRFPQDFVDDNVLYHLALSFLRQPGLVVTAEDPEQQKVLSALAQLKNVFGAKIMGANGRQEERSYTTNLPVHVSNDQHHAQFDFDRASAVELVEYLESIATVFFDKIVDRDLLVVSEIFEKQASHPTAWFTVKPGGTSNGEEDKPVTSMYTMLDILMASEGNLEDGGKNIDKGTTLQQKLPSAVRDALAAQSLFRGWIAIHIIEIGIGLERRQERLSKLLDALWICRARMLKLRGDDHLTSASQNGNLNVISDTSVPFREPTIGSFVESAIVSTLGSSESRIFLRAWQGVAAARGGKCDGLDDLMPKQIDPEMRSAIELSGTPDIGWILTCLAEAATKAPSIHTSAADLELIDFEKRRTIWAIIDGAVRLRPACNVPELVDLAGARLRLMQGALTRVIWDRRAFREEAANEMRNAPPVRSEAGLRPTNSSKALPSLSKFQQEKLRRDREALEMLSSLPLRPSISSRVSSMPSSSARALAAPSSSSASTQVSSENAAMTRAPPPDKATIRARRMTALFKGAVRPLISLDKPDAPIKSVPELMRLTPLQKPSIVAGLGGARVSIWNNTQRSFVFHLTSQEGAKYLLQTTNAAELAEWIEHIERASKDYAVQTSPDTHKGAVPIKGKAVQSPLYGRPLKDLVEHEGHSVPTAIERMFAEIEARGLREQGIYRISGSKSAVENLRRAWDQQPAESVDLSTGEFSDIHTIAGAVKTWLRELPEPLITFDSYDGLIATNAMDNDDRLYAMRDIIWKMPKCHFDVLRRTAEHLARVVEEGETNKMLAHNVALVFGTSLLNPPPGPSSVAIGFGNLGKAANVVKTIVTMHEWLFEPEPEPEAVVDAEIEDKEGPEQTVAAEKNHDGSSAAVDAQVTDALTVSSLPPDLSCAPGTPLSSLDESIPAHVGDSATLPIPDEQEASKPAELDGEEDEPVSELPVRSRRGGRARPPTIVGLDGLSAFGGTDAVAKVLASRERTKDMRDDVVTQIQETDETAVEAEASIESETTHGAPRIVLSAEMDSECEAPDGEGSLSAGDDSTETGTGADEAEGTSRLDGNIEEQLTGAQDNKASQDADASPGLAVASARPRKTRSSYRDSVFTSYSIYADCFDSMKLESQPSAASIVKRQSMQLLGQPSVVPDATVTNTKINDA